VSINIFDIFDRGSTLVRPTNIVPFHSILASISKNHGSLRSFAMGNVIGNILIFIPMGIYLSLFKKDKRFLGNLIILALISTIVELVQWVWGIGVLDIDDVILNSIGGWLGIIIYKILGLILHDEKKVSSAIAMHSAIIGLPVAFYLLFMVQMRF
jgi:glycopeptide antibiotics resistance protein